MLYNTSKLQPFSTIGHALKRHVDAMASCGAATTNIALVGMLAGRVAIHRGRICERVLLHVLRPAYAMPGFLPPSIGYCTKGDRAIITSTYKSKLS